LDPDKQKRQHRRALIHQAWEEHYGELVLGEISMAQILGYDDQRLMMLADRGLSLYNAGKLRSARKVFKGIVLLDPWVPYFHYLLATVHEKLGDLVAADSEFGKAIELTGQMQPAPELLGFAMLARGRVLARTGRIQEALALLARVNDGTSPVDPIVSNTARLIAEHLQGTADG
jgi:tetratricopeptide (TPR) repeat protein